MQKLFRSFRRVTRKISVYPHSPRLWKITSNIILSFVENNNIFTKYQYGFRPKVKTVSATVNLVREIAAALDSSPKTAGVFCDTYPMLLTVLFTVSFWLNLSSTTSANRPCQEWVLIWLTENKGWLFSRAIPSPHVSGSWARVCLLLILAILNSVWALTWYYNRMQMTQQPFDTRARKCNYKLNLSETTFWLV